MGVGRLANPGRAGRGAGPEAAAAHGKMNTNPESKRERKDERNLGDLQGVEEVVSLEVIKKKKRRKEEEGTNCCDVHIRRNAKVKAVAQLTALW